MDHSFVDNLMRFGSEECRAVASRLDQRKKSFLDRTRCLLLHHVFKVILANLAILIAYGYAKRWLNEEIKFEKKVSICLFHISKRVNSKLITLALLRLTIIQTQGRELKWVWMTNPWFERGLQPQEDAEIQTHPCLSTMCRILAHRRQIILGISAVTRWSFWKPVNRNKPVTQNRNKP